MTIDGLARALTLAWVYEHPTQALESQIRESPEAAMSGDVEMPPTTQDKDSETSVGGDLTRWVPWLEAQARRGGGWSREELAALDLMAVLLGPRLWTLPAAEAHQRWERLRVAINQFGVERVPRREEVAYRCEGFGDVLDPDFDVPCQYGVESVEAYQMSIRLGRSSTYLMYRLGLGLEERLGRYADAEAAYRKALELDPEYACAHRRLGDLLQFHLGRYEEAEAAYRRAMDLDPTDAYPHDVLGNLLHHRLGRCEEAEAVYRKAMELDPRDAYPHRGLGDLLQYRLGRYEEAEAAYRKALELDPMDANSHNGLGNLLQHRLGRYEEAEAAYRKAIELDPKYARPYGGLGNLLQFHSGRYEEAEAAYRKAIELDPKYARPYGGLGNLLQFHSGRYEEAEAAYRKAIELDPKNAHPHNALCLLYQFHLGRWREAGEAIERAIELAPDNSDCRETRGLYLEESVDLNGAERSFREGLRCRPGELENTVGIGWVALQSRDDITAAREALASLSVSDRARPSATLLEAGLVVWEGRWAEAQPLLARWIRELPATVSHYPWTQRSRWCALMRRSGIPVPWSDWHRLFTEASVPASWTEWITAIEALRDGRPAAELSERRSRWIYSCISVGPTFSI